MKPVRQTRFSAGTARRSAGNRSTSTSNAISAWARPSAEAGQKCPAGPEGQVGVGAVALQVQNVGVLEGLRVEVGALQQDQDQFALLDQHVADPHVLQGDPRQAVAHGQVPAQEFVHRRAHPLGMRAQVPDQLRPLEQCEDREHQERGGGDRTRPEERDGDRREHVVGQVRRLGVGLLQPGEPAEEPRTLLGRQGELRVQPLDEVADVLVPVERRVREGLPRRHERHVQARHQPASVLEGNSQYPTVQRRRERVRETGPEVGRSALGHHPVDELPGRGAQPVLKPLLARVERLHHRVAQPGAVDVAHVVHDLGRDRERVLAGDAGVRRVLEAEALVLQHLLGQRVAAHQPGRVPGEGADPGDRRLLAQPGALLREHVTTSREREVEEGVPGAPALPTLKLLDGHRRSLRSVRGARWCPASRPACGSRPPRPRGARRRTPGCGWRAGPRPARRGHRSGAS